MLKREVEKVSDFDDRIRCLLDVTLFYSDHCAHENSASLDYLLRDAGRWVVSRLRARIDCYAVYRQLSGYPEVGIYFLR